LPWPTPTVTAGEQARIARHQVRPDLHDPVLDLQTWHAVEQREIGFLPERENDGIGFELFELAGRLREP
jgi:hypothetical protein